MLYADIHRLVTKSTELKRPRSRTWQSIVRAITVTPVQSRSYV